MLKPVPSLYSAFILDFKKSKPLVIAADQKYALSS